MIHEAESVVAGDKGSLDGITPTVQGDGEDDEQDQVDENVPAAQPTDLGVGEGEITDEDLADLLPTPDARSMTATLLADI
jgi:hypothetical protein